MSFPRRKSFTLIELVVATMIATLIMGACYGSFHAVARARETVDARCLLYQDGRRALEEITRAIRQAAVVGGQGPQFLGDNSEDTAVGDDRITLYSLSDRPARLDEPEGELYETSFFILRDTETGTAGLVRRKDPGVDEQFLDGGVLTFIAQNVVGLDLEYYDGLVWSDEWVEPQSSSVPRAVGVMILVADPAQRTRPVTLATVVVPVVSVLGGQDASQGQGQEQGEEQGESREASPGR